MESEIDKAYAKDYDNVGKPTLRRSLLLIPRQSLIWIHERDKECKKTA